MDERTRTRMIDMRDYAAKAVELLGEMSSDAFIKDERTYFAVVKCVETVGEAASQVGRSQLSEILPDQPWFDIIGMRNILIHDYSGVSATTVFDTVRDFLPDFIATLDRLLEPNS